LTQNLKPVPNTLKIWPNTKEKLLPQNKHADTKGIEQVRNNPFFPSDHAMLSVTLEILKPKK